MRKRFDQSPAIDAASNLRLATMIQNHDEPYTAEEEEILRVGMSHFVTFEATGAKVKKAKSPTPTVKNEVAFKKGDPLGWGRSEALVRARKEEIIAYMWNLGARSRWTASDAERTVLEKKNNHHYIGAGSKRSTGDHTYSIQPRDYVSRFLWKKTEENTLVCVGSPTEHRERPLVAHKVRVKSPMALKCEEIKPGVCRVTYVRAKRAQIKARPRPR
jgi:hypothetical protein